MKLLLQAGSLVCLSVAAAVGCNQQKSPQDLKEQAAKETHELKQDAKAVAQGIREGWNRDDAVNLNTASREQLLKLPGVSPSEANRVIAGRPYNAPNDLVTRHVMSKSEFDKIAGRVTTDK